METNDWLINRLDKLNEKQDEMNSILIENTTSLKEHMRRTELLEEEIKPIKADIQFVNNVAKFVSIVMAGLITTHSLGLI